MRRVCRLARVTRRRSVQMIGKPVSDNANALLTQKSAGPVPVVVLIDVKKQLLGPGHADIEKALVALDRRCRA
jgi:hypothetical protein